MTEQIDALGKTIAKVMADVVQLQAQFDALVREKRIEELRPAPYDLTPYQPPWDRDSPAIAPPNRLVGKSWGRF